MFLDRSSTRTVQPRQSRQDVPELDPEHAAREPVFAALRPRSTIGVCTEKQEELDDDNK